jgi:hypothetical protein
MGNPKQVAITVHIKDDPTKYPPEPPYEFWLDTDDNKVGKKKGHDLTFDNDGKYDGFDITFEIDDHTGKGFKFMDIGEDANGDPDPNLAPMWVKTVPQLGGKDCPDHEFWHQFRATKVFGNNKKLSVRNENNDEHFFKFAFMFSRTPDKGPYEIMYDPGGTNMNGTKPFYSAGSVAAAAVGGAIVGSLLTLGVQALIN